MATEKTISSAAISFDNFMTSSSAAALPETAAEQSSSTNMSTEQSLYPRSNLTSPQRSKTWRSADNGTKTHAAIGMDSGTLRIPEVFALIDSNLSYSVGALLIAGGAAETLQVAPNNAALTATQVMLQGSNSSAFSATQDFTYNLYDADSHNGVLRFYIDKDDGGTALPAFGYRYWRVVFNRDSTAASYIELGQFWLGTVTDIAPEIKSLRSKQNDASAISASYSGAQYVDKIKPIRSIEFGIEHAEDAAEAIPLQKLAASSGATSEALIDISAWSSDSTRKSADTYYGRLRGTGFSWSANFQRRRSVKLAFVEAR